MKNILPWLKKNWLIPSLCLVMVIILATTWWFSASWNDHIRATQSKDANDLLTKVNNVKVTYALPITAGSPAVELASPPNEVLTRQFAERRKAILEQREGVVRTAEAFNKGDKKPLIEGLFPAPAAGTELLRPLEFVQKLVGNPTQGTPSAYQQLLDSLRAGGPISNTQLEAQLNDILKRETEKIRGANTTRELTAQEKEGLAHLLLEARRDQYVRRANEISIYADMSIFPSPAATTPGTSPSQTSSIASSSSNQIPLSVPTTPPSVRQAFIWQSDYWLLQDIFAIVRNANSGPGGKLLPERDAVIKRIEKIDILPWRPQTASEGPEGATGAAPAAGGEFASSISGHADPNATTYDVRRARVTLIVSSSRLPQLFDAVSRTNFASVVGLAMEKVDGWQDLAQGYYYGDENVVRVVLDIELTWLRSWTEPLFPPAIRKGLGLPDLPPPGEANQNPANGPK
ncbi:MAG: hypothetical protein U0570_11650 [Phycisphaerales bacterium]